MCLNIADIKGLQLSAYLTVNCDFGSVTPLPLQPANNVHQLDLEILMCRAFQLQFIHVLWQDAILFPEYIIDKVKGDHSELITLVISQNVLEVKVANLY